MSEDPVCVRCKRSLKPIPKVPYPGRLGEEIQEKTCADCWAEWQHAEVKVINELRLNFMDPRSNDILIQHMREFLCLEPESPSSE
ncbi:MAG: Fe(2+)-trafficking protein [Thermoanaerobaculia bacterium]